MTHKLLLTLTGILCSLLLATAAASAQTATFAALFTQVRSGDTISVTDANGQEFTGKLTDATSAGLTLGINGANREFRESGTRKVVRRDSAKNGVLIGFGVGAVPGVVLGSLFMTYCTNEATSCPLAPIYGGTLTGLLGALAGYEIDRHINAVLYKSAGQSPTVRVAPVLDRSRHGVAVSLAF